MNKKYIKLLFALPLAILCLSCNDYLDEMPDNRAEIDSEEKVNKLLVSAYPKNSYILCCELASDNTDNYGTNNPNTNRFLDQLYTWADVTETDNESPQRVWEACYMAITNANQALQAINEMGNPEALNAARGEALLCRAYSHFLLVNIFCQNYSKQHSETDLGIPYMEAPETELNPQYERGNVAHVYELIEKDLIEGLPLINDAAYTVPKYHFNQKAAYTFASRFYLFYQNWDKVIEYANKALGTAPTELMRDYAALAEMPKDPLTNISNLYISTASKTNFLVQTAYSQLGVIYGPYYTGSRYSHGNLIAQTETFNQAPWGNYPTDKYDYRRFYILYPNIYAGTNLDKTLMPRIPYLFEIKDPVAQTGYSRAVYVALSAEEALLNRAEAYIMKEMYSEALKDINLWTGNTLHSGRVNPVLTEDIIQSWAKSYEYYTPSVPTPKKRLNPDFMTITEGSKQESFIHCVLYLRRQEFIHEGMRWFDIKRYGIEIYRREVNGLQIVAAENDVLKVRDNRRAMQLPKDVISAGITPNPRDN